MKRFWKKYIQGEVCGSAISSTPSDTVSLFVVQVQHEGEKRCPRPCCWLLLVLLSVLDICTVWGWVGKPRVSSSAQRMYLCKQMERCPIRDNNKKKSS